MRNWQLSAGDPLALRLAADARQFHTDYTDDQIWKLVMGEGQSPALALETRYGGRCGLARLVPMWVIDGQVVYEAAVLESGPILHSFTPGYVRLTLQPVPGLVVQAEFWAATSHVLGGRFSFRNETERIIETGADLFVQIMTEQRPGEINILTLDNGQFALHAKQVGNLNPVILMHAVRSSSQPSPKLAARVTIPPGEKNTLRWVHAARPDVRESLALAHHWLYKEDWEGHLQALRTLEEAVPTIDTGDRARDATLAFSTRVALSSMVGPTGALPHPSLVMTRVPARGFSARGDGQDHYWQWAGQRLPEMYAAALALAAAAPDLAEGLVRNALATQAEDGAVDGAPGLGGQRSGLLAMPLLAALSWQLYGYTGRAAFLHEVFPGLLRFFMRWFAPDVDADADGAPEWQAAAQTGLTNHPLFAPFLRYAQNADIRFAETPQLVALLIREARSLLAMAEVLDAHEQIAGVAAPLAALEAALEALWDAEAGVFAYRDRDTHASVPGQVIIEGPGDQDLIPSLELTPANRLVVRVRGGRDHRPARLTVRLEGLDAQGQPLAETLETQAFAWYRNNGTATSRQVYARLDRVTAEGLSRVYTVAVHSIDWTVQDITCLLPLLVAAPGSAPAEALIAALTDPARYGRATGVPLVPAESPLYDPVNQNGCGGMWPAWNTLLAEGLIEIGRADLAADLFSRLLAAQIATLRAEQDFHEFYHPDQPVGLGDQGYVSGIVPLHLFWRLAGFTVISPEAVSITGELALPWPVRVRHYGVTVERTSRGVQIAFPSGTVKRLRSDRPRLIADDGADAPRLEAPRAPAARPAPGPEPRGKPQAVHVPVQPSE